LQQQQLYLITKTLSIEINLFLQKIRQDLIFFQNVLRELEQKKPQLDDLVKTAENLRESPIRQQIPEKG
jgi:hypothetical protein